MKRAASLLALSLLAASAAAQSRHRGQLTLQFSVRDRGVAQATVERYALEVELTITRDDRARLTARGTLDRATTTMAPPAAPRSEAQRDIDAVHEGRVVARDARSFTIAWDRHGPWRCERDESAWRCALTTPHDGAPWTDPAPRYLRAPLVLSRAADVRADVHADHEHEPTVHITRARPAR